jgi:glycosyltransferase involved in cell wall biosynthesis
MTEKRLTLIGPVTPYRGGISHFTTMLAHRLKAESCEVQVISFKRLYPAWLYPGKSDKDLSKSRLKVAADYTLTPLSPVSWVRTIRAIRAFNPDRVVFQWWVTFLGLAYFSLLSGLRRYQKSAVIHNVIPHEARFFDRFIARLVLKRMDRLILLSEQERDRLRQLLPEKKDVQVAPLPVFSMFPDVDCDRYQARKKLGLGNVDQPIVLFFGFIRPYKGLQDLLAAVGLLKEQGIDLKLLVVGEFWQDKSDYEAQVSALGIDAQVMFFDRYVPDHEVGYFFRAADVFAAPYRSGTQSAAIKAAINFGLPLVLTDVIADRISRSYVDEACIVPPRDPAHLAEALKKGLKRKSPTPDVIQNLIDETWQVLTQALDVDVIK